MTQRVHRLEDQVQKELARLIQQELRDPRIGMVTISAVKLSKDLGYADVYVTVLSTRSGSDALPESEEEREEASRLQSLKGLNAASGYLRNLLGKVLTVRMIPRLRFHYDEVLARAQRLSHLIQEAVRQEDERHD